MEQAPFSITVFAVSGDSQGIRQVEKSNWSGKGIVFRRDQYDELRRQPGFDNAAVYILTGYGTKETIYIGEADPVGDRLRDHVGGTKTWDWGVYFFDTQGRVGKTEAQFLESELIRLGREYKRSLITNKTDPTQPTMSAVSAATAQAFLNDVLLVLPLLGMIAFTEPETEPEEDDDAEPIAPDDGKSADDFDTVVVPAGEENFENVFLKENTWYQISIQERNLSKIKYIAVYRRLPVGAITHIAEVADIVPYKDTGKYRLNFKNPAVAIDPIPRVEHDKSMQRSRYALREQLLKAKTLDEVWK